jgi:DNA-binding beta-propeller fold protein YncE
MPARPAVHEEVRKIAASTAPQPSANVRIRGGGATPRRKSVSGGRVLPPVRVPRLAIFAALAVALVALLIWWQLPGSVEESREERFATLMAEAREANASAESTSDAGLKRQLLTEAEAKLADASKIHDDNGELVALQADVSAAIGVLNAVYEVREFTPISDIAQQVTGSLSITQTVIGGGNAYLLDADDRRVLRVPLAGGGAPETILQDGEAGFVTPTRPTSIAWAEQTGTLIIIDANRQAFAYTPGADAAVPIPVRDAAELGSLDAIAASGENLYALDVAGSQVWRYLPGQSGFDSERIDLLGGATLTDATELAVSQDVYVLDRKLGIRRFTGRDEIQFPLAGIDRPLMEPASLTVLPGSNRLVVADRGNKRIVVVSPEGAFLRQIVSPAFTDLRAAAVDEGTGTLYVLNGDVLMQAAFPP